MKRIFLRATIAVALFAAAPAIAQGLGPNDASIDQIGESSSAMVSRTGALETSKGSDIDQISGNAAITHARKAKLSKAVPQATDGSAHVIQVGPGDLGRDWSEQLGRQQLLVPARHIPRESNATR